MVIPEEATACALLQLGGSACVQHILIAAFEQASPYAQPYVVLSICS